MFVIAGVSADDAVSILDEVEPLALLSHCDVMLCIYVLDADRFSKDMFLGAVVFPLPKLPMNAPCTKWYPLCKRSGKDKVRTSGFTCQCTDRCDVM